MALFKRKQEFRPDKEQKNILGKLYLTKKQRATLGKWLLMAAFLVLLSVVQDVILSRANFFGTTTDLVPLALIMACIMLDPEVGSVFMLVGSSLYYFAGNAPGTYVIVLLTALGILVSILRQNYLRYSFGTVALCSAVAMLLYEICIFAIGFFLGMTTGSRFGLFLITALVSLVAMPILYPIFTAIGKIGGETWKD